MKCKSCHKLLNDFYINLGLGTYCKACAADLIEDVSDFQLDIIKQGEDKHDN